MRTRLIRVAAITVAATLLALAGPVAADGHDSADPPAPDQVLPSDLTVELELVGQMPFELGPGFVPTNLGPNLASPVAIGNALYLIDQNDAIYRSKRGGQAPLEKIFDVDDDHPGDGLTLDRQWAVLNVAPGPSGNKVWVVLSSSTEPTADVPIHRLPDPLPGLCCDVTNPFLVDDLYRIGDIPGPFSFFGPTSTEWQVLYEFTLRRGRLGDPRPIMAFETQYGPTHNGGALLRLNDNRLLYSTGDALTFGADGRAAPQDPAEHVGKLLLINPAQATFEVAALGLRNVQHLEMAQIRGVGPRQVAFADIGGVTAEEVNIVSLRDLRDTRHAENFGWGRNPDGNAREGTFYIEPGIPAGGGAEPPVEAHAPSPEAGFVQPHAQYGRNDPSGGVAVSGPVTSYRSFREITALFGDLSSSIVYATTADHDQVAAPVFRVDLVDTDGNPIPDLTALTGGTRADPRFFRFPDGSAGVLLEATGEYYRLTERR